jgi:hypothetical protein
MASPLDLPRAGAAASALGSPAWRQRLSETVWDYLNGGGYAVPMTPEELLALAYKDLSGWWYRQRGGVRVGGTGWEDEEYLAAKNGLLVGFIGWLGPRPLERRNPLPHETLDEWRRRAAR